MSPASRELSFALVDELDFSSGSELQVSNDARALVSWGAPTRASRAGAAPAANARQPASMSVAIDLVECGFMFAP